MNEELKIKLKIDIGDALAKVKEVKKAFADVAGSSKISGSIDSARESTGKLQSQLKSMNALSFGGMIASLKGVKAAQAGVAASTVAAQASVRKLANDYKKEYDEMAKYAKKFKDKNSDIYKGDNAILEWEGDEEALANYNLHMKEANDLLEEYNKQMKKANKLNEEFGKNNKKVGKSTKEAGAAAGAGAKSMGGFGKSMAAIGKAAAIAVAAIGAVVGAIVALGKNTLEFQKEQAKLNTAFLAVGSTAEQAGESYKGLFRFLGESSRSVEAASHLAKITTNQKDLAEWTKICQGVYATFGDSLPIEGLTEAANETIRTGAVTGTLADALNWAGVSEDAFNEKLAQTTSLSEREALVRSTLNGLYSNAAEIYERNNKALLDYNESQARLDSTMAAAGAVTMPLLTAINNLGSAFYTALKPALEVIVPILTTFVNWITKGIEAVTSFFAALTGKSTTIKAFGEINASAAGATKNLGSAANNTQKLASGMGAAKDAAGGAAKAAEEAKKSTQGFDELNIVPSGKTDTGGGSGGGGGAGGGIGGGIIDSAAFGAEIEESEGTANSFLDSLKERFAGLKDIFAPSIEAWSGAFDTIKKAWDEAKPHFMNGLNEIKEAFVTVGTYIATEFVPNVVNSFSVNIAPVIGDTIGFAIKELGLSFEWAGGLINDVTNDIIVPALKLVETIFTDTFGLIGSAWQEHGQPLLDEMGVFAEEVRTLLTNLYENVIAPIVSNLLAAFTKVWKEGIEPMLSKAVNAALRIGQAITKLYNEILSPILNWLATNVLPIIVDIINNIVNIVADILVSLQKVIGGLIDLIAGIIDFIVGVFTGDWEMAWEGIKSIFSGIWDIMCGLCEAAWGIITGIIEVAWDIIVGIFEVAWELIKGIWNVVVAWFEGLWNGIVKVFSVVADWFSDIFSKAWEGIKNIWNVVVEWFSDLWDGICEVFSVVADWFKDMFSKAWENIKAIWNVVVEWFRNIWNGIVNVFNVVANWFKEQFSNAWENIKQVWSVVIQWFKDIWTGISNAFSGAATWFRDKFQEAWSNIQGVWNAVTGWFSGVWTGIKNVFSGVGTWFKDIFSTAWTNIKNVFSNWGSFFSGLWDKIKTTFSALGTKLGDAIGGAVKKGINGVLGSIEKIINSGINLINGAIGLINKIPGVNVGKIGKLSLPRLAKGGIVDAATIAMIGEQGKEAVVPLENNTEWMDKLADRIAARRQAPTKVVLMVGEKELGWATIDAINGITKQTGELKLAL